MSEIEVTSPAAETPPYDFGSGDLREKAEALKRMLGIGQPAADENNTEHGEGPPQEKDDEGTPPIDWDRFELDPRFAHLYYRSTVEMTEDGELRILAPVVMYRTESLTFSKAGQVLTQLVNGPEEWKVVTILPNGAGMLGAVLMRNVRTVLPVPKMIETETVVPDPDEDELNNVDAEGQAWATGGTIEGADYSPEGKTDA